MSVTAAKVKELREKSGAGFSLCKEALRQCDGDLDEASEWLRAKGASIAQKKSGRETTEGRIAFACNNNRGALVEVLTETDFVANNDTLRNFADLVARSVATSPDGSKKIGDISHEGTTINEACQEITLKTGENIQLGRHKTLDAKHNLHHYIHHNGKIGVMADISAPEGSQLGKDICMQIASMRPEVVDKDDFDAEQVLKLKKVFEAEMAQSGKDITILEKIITGKVNKYLSERALLLQDFVKDDKKKVRQHLMENDALVDSFAAIHID